MASEVARHTMRDASRFMYADDEIVDAADHDRVVAEARELLQAAAHYATKMEPMSAKLLNGIDAWLEKNQ